MTKSMIAGLAPVHPGEILREDVLPALGRSKTEIAKLLHVSRQSLYDILDEKQAITAPMAVRLGKLCGNGPNLWLAMQSSYDIARAEAVLKDELESIPTLGEAA
jgi:addiction module HigA family antidote